MAANQAVVMEFSRQLDVQRIEQLQREVETLRDENKRMTVVSEKSGRDQHEFVRYNHVLRTKTFYPGTYYWKLEAGSLEAR